jgi:DNA polymerase IIIc chi subunit
MQTMNKKRPTIRPGQQKPYVKATRREVEQRIKAAAWLANYLEYEPSLVYDFFHEVFDIEPRQIARYLARARVREAHERGFSGGYGTSSY